MMWTSEFPQHSELNGGLSTQNIIIHNVTLPTLT